MNTIKIDIVAHQLEWEEEGFPTMAIVSFEPGEIDMSDIVDVEDIVTARLADHLGGSITNIEFARMEPLEAA